LTDEKNEDGALIELYDKFQEFENRSDSLILALVLKRFHLKQICSLFVQRDIERKFAESEPSAAASTKRTPVVPAR